MILRHTYSLYLIISFWSMLIKLGWSDQWILDSFWHFLQNPPIFIHFLVHDSEVPLSWHQNLFSDVASLKKRAEGFGVFSFTTSGWLINEACHTDLFSIGETTTGDSFGENLEQQQLEQVLATCGSFLMALRVILFAKEIPWKTSSLETGSWIWI